MSPSPLVRVRSYCLSLPLAAEKLSHGTPCFFLEGGRQFASYLENHHNDGRLALWLPAPPGIQEALIQEDPVAYFRPPYVGPSGWVGVCLDKGLPWETITNMIDVAHQMMFEKLPKRVRARVQE